MSRPDMESPPERSANRGAIHSMSETAAAPIGNDLVIDQSTGSGTHNAGYSADARWQHNFERMALRAALDQSFFEIAGGAIQHYATKIRARWS